MARQKLSEHRAKQILMTVLCRSYPGILLDNQSNWRAALADLPLANRYVAKVDEGVKGRFKRGLVKLNLTADTVPVAAAELFGHGYRYVLVEPQLDHESADERYVSIERIRDGLKVLVNRQGGVDVNAAAARMEEYLYSPATAPDIASHIGLTTGQLGQIIQAFEDNYLGFLEINPLVVMPPLSGAGEPVPYPLDAAVEVDGEAASLVAGRWSAVDLRSHKTITPEEAAILDLASRSQSSFRLEVLNPEGQVFLLLSGGGASVTLADEVHNQGWGKALANYGEYSGNPTADETYVYTKQILSLLLKSSARPKVLVIAGGVANFTDIRVTFSGVIRAIQEVQGPLAEQGVKVYVRRGGPHEAEGLARIKDALAAAGLLGQVSGPELILADIIPAALSHLTTGASQ